MSRLGLNSPKSLLVLIDDVIGAHGLQPNAALPAVSRSPSRLRVKADMRSESHTRIDSFMSYFHEFMDRLAEVPDEPPFAVLKKLGFVAAIDGLSKVGASNESRNPKNRERFVSFIQKFSNWSDGERISLPHLVEALSRDTEPEFQPLKECVNSLFQSEKWSPRSAILPGPHNITRDPMPDQVLDRWPKGKKVLGKLSEENFCHVNLLYAYRNSLAHELREPGLPRLESDVPYAHYHYTPLYAPNKEGQTCLLRKAWLLHYPVGFFSTITLTFLRTWESGSGKKKSTPMTITRSAASLCWRHWSETASPGEIRRLRGSAAEATAPRSQTTALGQSMTSAYAPHY